MPRGRARGQELPPAAPRLRVALASSGVNQAQLMRGARASLAALIRAIHAFQRRRSPPSDGTGFRRVKRAPPKRVRRRAERVVATVHFGFEDKEPRPKTVEDVLREHMGVSRDDSPVSMPLEDHELTRLTQRVWPDGVPEPKQLKEMARQKAKERIADELRRQGSKRGARKMQELAAERRERAEPVFRAIDEAAKVKGDQPGRRELARQARQHIKPDDPRKDELTERRARNYRKSPTKTNTTAVHREIRDKATGFVPFSLERLLQSLRPLLNDYLASR